MERMTSDDLAGLARGILDANRYMTLGTADASGRPWVSPVYYALDGYRDVFWVSSPEARHSQNIAIRPEVSLVMFDSRTSIGEGQAVYMVAVAEQLTGPELVRGIEVFSRRSVEHGARPWEPSDVRAPSLLRAYRATATELSVLDATAEPGSGRGDERIPVTL
jgi:hypothetical protein